MGAPNRIPLNRSSLSSGNSNGSSASSWEEPQKHRQLLLHSSLQNRGGNQRRPSVAVNIDPPVRNKGATSVWWQINKDGGGQSEEKHMH